MAGITLAQAEAKLQEYLDAESKILLGQSYTIGNRQMTRADLSKVISERENWQRKVSELTNAASGKGRSRTICPGW